MRRAWSRNAGGSLRSGQLGRLRGVLHRLLPLALVEDELIALGRDFAELVHHRAGSDVEVCPHMFWHRRTEADPLQVWLRSVIREIAAGV